MQNINLIGNLTKDPELRTTPNGRSVCNMTIAVNSVRRSRDDKTKTESVATFYRLTAWDKEAENCGKYLSRGRRIGCHGELSVSVAKDENGNVLFYKSGDKTGEPIINLDVAVEGRVEFLSSQNMPADGAGDNKGAPAPAPAPAAEPAAAAPAGFTAIETDELPF